MEPGDAVIQRVVCEETAYHTKMATPLRYKPPPSSSSPSGSQFPPLGSVLDDVRIVYKLEARSSGVTVGRDGAGVTQQKKKTTVNRVSPRAGRRG